MGGYELLLHCVLSWHTCDTLMNYNTIQALNYALGIFSSAKKCCVKCKGELKSGARTKPIPK